MKPEGGQAAAPVPEGNEEKKKKEKSCAFHMANAYAIHPPPHHPKARQALFRDGQG